MRNDPRHLISSLRSRSRSRDRERALAAESESSELRERIALQWAEVRAARRTVAQQPEIVGGPSNLARAQVPYGVDLAAAWAWRFIVISVAGLAILWLLNFFMVVVLPIVIALLIAALVGPVVAWLTRFGLSRKIAALLVVIGLIGVIALALTFVSSQVANGAGDLSKQVTDGIGQVREWLRTGPLHVTDSQLSKGLDNAEEQLSNLGKDSLGKLSEVSTAVSHVVAGLFIVLFATYFFLADGQMIWGWLVRLFPRAGRLRAHSSGKVAWQSLTQFVRATVMVAGTDAIGVMIGAAVLGVPFVGAIGVLVFIGAFIPMVGAFVSGVVAVLVALVAQGPFVALLMFGVVVLIQQLEAHVLQPFLMGRFVSVHPLGVIVALALGIIVAGIPGALIAVPLAASLNAVVQHLANYTEVGEGVEEAAEQDPATPDLDAEPEEAADAHDAPRTGGTDPRGPTGQTP